MRANFILSGVWEGIRRNLSMTLALILSTSLLLTFVGTAILANTVIDKFSSTYEGKLNVSVFLCTKISVKPCTAATTLAQQKSLKAKLDADPLVTNATYVSPEENTRRAKEQSPPSIAKYIEPGSLPGTFTVKLKDINKDFNAFYLEYSKEPGVSQVNNQIGTIRKLLDIIDGMRTASIGIAIVVLIASVLLIANTIQVAAAQRRNETSIMRLVGASRIMTELPFMLEAVVATVVGGILAYGMVSIGKYFVLNNVFKGQVENGVIPNLTGGNLADACLLSMVGGIVLSALTAFATLRLRVKL